MENIITKELLGKVLKIEIISHQMKQKNIIGYEYNKLSKNEWSGKKFCNRSINIYELADKYKEWAFNSGFAFRIEHLGEKDINIQLINCKNEKTEYSKDFYNIRNIEHIITPCQWIFDKNIKG